MRRRRVRSRSDGFDMRNLRSIYRPGANQPAVGVVVAVVTLTTLVLSGAVTGRALSDEFSFPTTNERYEHDTCSLTGSMPRTGICRKAADCPRGIHSKGERCEFSGNHAVVCCPERAVGAGSDGSANRYQSRISKQECENFERLDSSNLTDHISGLKFRAELGEFPFMALVEFDGKDNAHVKCGAALISKRFLLTAAHCTRDYNISSVRLGMVETKDREATPYDVRQIVVHPGYKTRRNDIALIEVTKDVASTRFIQPICLNTDLLDIGSTVNLTIMGWGVDANDNRADTLFKATVKEVPLGECRARFRKLSFNIPLNESQICALGEKFGNETTDSCQGDSGGPLVVNINDKFYIAGVVSFGLNCGQEIPGIYTRVSHYLDWIEQIVWASQS